jgi:8-oxo-dGTP diphosphatase
MEIVFVTAAVIVDQQKILVAQRMERDSQGLLWEFPGGKVRMGEEPREALERELREELGIEAKAGGFVEAVYHVYPEYPILLLVYRCHIAEGIPRPIGCRDLRWVAMEDLWKLPMPPADDPIREKLCAMGG